jgi:hypothetical protein
MLNAKVNVRVEPSVCSVCKTSLRDDASTFRIEPPVFAERLLHHVSGAFNALGLRIALTPLPMSEPIVPLTAASVRLAK